MANGRPAVARACAARRRSSRRRAAAPDADRIVSLGAPDFDALLTDVERRYGAATRSLVALQIEYPPGR